MKIGSVAFVGLVIAACGEAERSLCQVSAGDCGYVSDADCQDVEPTVGDACGQALVCYYCNETTAQGYDCIGGAWRQTRTYAVCG